MSPRARRALFSVTVFFAVCALVGTVLQRKVGAQSSENESQLRDSLKDFANVYSIVESNYAEPLTGDKASDVIYDGAIPGMLRTLDPHSNFYDPKAYAAMREGQSGHYYGVGMVIQQQGDYVYVVTPYENTPSYRAGIHPGDKIVDIEGKNAEGWTADQVSKALKGPKGTHVQVTMARDGAAKPLVFDLVRDEIPHPAVDLAYEIHPGVGYIQITDFTDENTAGEFSDALKKFGPNLKGLVIDLRGNPGGLLSQAVDVCDQLLAKGQVIVSQRGRAYPDQVYTATHGNDGKDFPIVVLVNRNTASAAEIVSGALQDHDRALIVGQTTFGKGLVQTVYNLSQDTGLALTTYHYFTPSGRLIQRDYAGVSLYDYYYNHAGALPPNSTNREVKFTDSGRTVYGGGGITPDDKIAMPDLSNFQEELLYKDAFLHFAPMYVADHQENKGFQVNDAVMTQFEKYLTGQDIDWTAAEVQTNRDWIGAHIEQEVDTIWFGNQDGLKTYSEWDPVLQKAVTYLPQAEALEINAQKVMAEKAEARNTGAQGVPMQP
ncbi:MAG: S41 family peptidase [Terracidiphilus sp.]